MDIYILVWDTLKMCGGIILIKSILSLSLMVVSPVAKLICTNREREQREDNSVMKLKKVCIKSWSILLYVLRYY